MTGISEAWPTENLRIHLGGVVPVVKRNASLPFGHIVFAQAFA